MKKKPKRLKPMKKAEADVDPEECMYFQRFRQTMATYGVPPVGTSQRYVRGETIKGRAL